MAEQVVELSSDIRSHQLAGQDAGLMLGSLSIDGFARSASMTNSFQNQLYSVCVARSLHLDAHAHADAMC